MPLAFEFAQRMLRCTHEWVQNARGTGVHGKVSIRFCDCQARMTVLAHPVRSYGEIVWKLFVSNQVQQQLIH